MKPFAIITFETDSIATVCTEDAAKKIDRDVRLALKHIEAAKVEADTAHREYMECDAKEGEVAAALKWRADTFALLARQQTEELDRYIDGEKAIFAAHGLPPERAYKEAIFATGETLPNGKAVFRIVKRGQSLEPVDKDDDSDASVRASIGYGDRIGISREVRRGKYNDGHLLIEQSSASIDPSEVVPFANPCV